MTHGDPGLIYRTRLGFSWFSGPLPPADNVVELALDALAARLEEIARELRMAYQNPQTRTDNIIVALNLLDVLQAELD